MIGIPDIFNYTKQNYNAGTQNMEIAQGANGIMYFANNLGMLAFDGVNWDLYKLQNRTALLSLAIDKKGRIFTGGQGEIGFFSPDGFGKLHYHPLNYLLSSSDNLFAEVWKVTEYNGHIFFRTNNKIFEYTGTRIIVHHGNYWSFLGKIGKCLVAYDSGKGLVELNKKSWIQILPRSKLYEVKSIVGTGQDSLLISTLGNKLFTLNKGNLLRFTIPAAREIEANGISCLTKLSSGNIAFGTLKAGVYIINKNGSLVQRITKADGLQSLHILTIKQDKDGNIWVGSDSGTDIIYYGDAIKHIYPEKENRNSGFTSVVFNHILYLGSTSGLYYLPLGNTTDISKAVGSFKPVEHADGQTWKLSTFHGKLLLSSSAGFFLIDKNKARPIDQSMGYWCVQDFVYQGKSYAMTGTFSGVGLFNYTKDSISSLKSTQSFESARFLVQHKGVLWAAHSYRGLFKIVMNKQQQIIIKKYEDKKKILGTNHNKIFDIGGRLILVGDKGIFEYDDRKGDFVKSIFFTKIFGQQLVEYLYEDRYQNIWFTGNKKVGVLSKKSFYDKILYFDELENKITFNFENINVVDSSNVIIGAEKGFFHLNLNTYTASHRSPSVLIRSVKSVTEGKDSLLYGGYGEVKRPLYIDHRSKDITINFIATEFRNPFNIKYSYFLKGFDDIWSDWSKKTAKEYSNLPPGRYTFYVKYLDGKNRVSKPVAYSFEILPVYYETWWAKLIYVIIIIGISFFLMKYQQKKYIRRQQAKLRQQRLKYEEEQRRLDVEHLLEVQEQQRQIMQLTNEKLQVELEHKNQELASSAMNLVRKIEVMSKLKENLEQYKSVTDDEKSKREFIKIIKTIDSEIDDHLEWGRFTAHFDKVHNNFLRNLKAHYPDISANELKLSAYLKLNITTKEIAQLMNISVRGVETARFRLRKKLSVSGDINLHDFLISFDEEAAPQQLR